LELELELELALMSSRVAVSDGLLVFSATYRERGIVAETKICSNGYFSLLATVGLKTSRLDFRCA
jgi:hypothetical protein